MYPVLEIEQEIRDFWKKINLLQLLEDQNKEGEPYFLLDGPPYANNIPHVGNIRNTIYKDLFIRRAFMQKKNVYFQPGFDTHGLPVENMVEKELGLKSKKDIETMGVAKFVAHCRKMAATNKELWIDVFDKLGSWYTWRKPYMTYDNSYVQSAWWGFKTMWDKDMVYEGKKPVYWCPHCETALSGYEVTDSYAMVSDPAVYLKFKLKEKDKSGEDQFLLVFTTTPWTLPSNVAVAVAPEEDYVKVKTGKGIIILAKERLEILTQMEVGYQVMEEFKGKDLDQKEYHPLIDCPAQECLNENDKAHKVYMSIPMLKSFVGSKIATKKAVEDDASNFDDFVTVTDGTGLVHTAPGHGKSDHDFGDHYKLPKVSPLDDQCKFTSDVKQYEGKFCKAADKEIMQDLEQEQKLFYHETIQHKYPLCWRCKSKLIFRLSDQWFIKIEPVKETMLKENQEINWQPDFARTRFHNWVEQAEDWNVSRQRYWGIPLPIWRTEDKSEVRVIGSLEELKQHAITPVPDDFDIHAASDIKLKSESGKEMTRVNDIADVWYDSGVAPWASFGYPFQNKELFERHFPCQRINEAQDQIRGWFYSLMFTAVGVFGKSSYKAVSMPGWLVDARGDKMSKSVGNVAWAKEVLEEIGGDMLRYYLFWDIGPYETVKFNIDVAKKEVARFLNVLWNLHNMVLNTNFEPGVKVGNLKTEDKWIISEFNSMIHQYKKGIEEFEFHDAGRGMQEFMVDKLSRWYIQLVRDRIQEGDNTPLQIVHMCLTTSCKLLLPVTPHVAEKIYQDFKDKFKEGLQSVHLESWPKEDMNLVNEELEELMAYTQKIVPAVLHAREKAKLSVRWPIQEVIVVSKDSRVQKAAKELQDIIKTQTNIREVKIVEEMDKVNITVTPDRAKIGQDFGANSQKVIAVIESFDPKELVKELDQHEVKAFELDGEKHHLVRAYLNVKREIEGPYQEGSFKEGRVYINTTRSKELDAEGYTRELARRIQALRKKAGMHKDQEISLHVTADKDFIDLVQDHQELLAKKVGATKFTIDVKPQEAVAQWNETFKIKDFEGKIEFSIL